MPRIQILNLPGPSDQYPFALVVDQWSSDALPADALMRLKGELGATAVLVFEDTVELPSQETSAPATGATEPETGDTA